ncbi:hypothetical protein GTY20_38620 [Streptomyces sp. SID4946]|nr:hypothetical protein [Streptomyces sp. SID4946]SCF62050.1 hypothetical protein GA0115258_10473 [Streptomyces sp. LamerLS-31b]SCG01793.1 hypothetical protein GA0115256_144121 [Streptomyces sp. DconLS]
MPPHELEHAAAFQCVPDVRPREGLQLAARCGRAGDRGLEHGCEVLEAAARGKWEKTFCTRTIGRLGSSPECAARPSSASAVTRARPADAGITVPHHRVAGLSSPGPRG